MDDLAAWLAQPVNQWVASLTVFIGRQAFVAASAATPLALGCAVIGASLVVAGFGGVASELAIARAERPTRRSAVAIICFVGAAVFLGVAIIDTAIAATS